MGKASLRDKEFFLEEDRNTVEKLVHGVIEKARLQDAITRQEPRDVQSSLSRLEIFGLPVINQAVNAGMDTFLHIATRSCVGSSSSVAIIAMLQSAGADPLMTNRRGDTPWQWFMWPLLHHRFA